MHDNANRTDADVVQALIGEVHELRREARDSKRLVSIVEQIMAIHDARRRCPCFCSICVQGRTAGCRPRWAL